MEFIRWYDYHAGKARPAFSKFSIPIEFISRSWIALTHSRSWYIGYSIFIFRCYQWLYLAICYRACWHHYRNNIIWDSESIVVAIYCSGLTVTNPEGSSAGNFLMYYEWLSIALMLIALWLGYQWYQRKTFKRAFFKPTPRLLYMFVPIILFALVFSYINKPVQLPSHERTEW